MKANLSPVWVCFNSGGKPNSVKEATDLKGERSYMFFPHSMYSINKLVLRSKHKLNLQVRALIG